MTKKTWGIFIAVCVLLIGGLVLYSASSRINVSDVNTNKIIPASTKNGNIGDNVTGDIKSPVIFVEYGDYQCPVCGDAYPQVKKVTDKYKSDVAIVFRNLPLTTLHPNALAAASAAQAAGLQGKYWQMHDLLYTYQSSWANLTGEQRTSQFADYAKQLGLNTKKFTNDMGSPAVSQKINFDRAIDSKLNLDSTPTFYIGGKQVSSAVQKDAVSGSGKLLDEAFASALKAHNMAPPASN